jgi:hypothetical protein
MWYRSNVSGHMLIRTFFFVCGTRAQSSPHLSLALCISSVSLNSSGLEKVVMLLVSLNLEIHGNNVADTGM